MRDLVFVTKYKKENIKEVKTNWNFNRIAHISRHKISKQQNQSPPNAHPRCECASTKSASHWEP